MENDRESIRHYLGRIRECFPELVISQVQIIDEGLVNDMECARFWAGTLELQWVLGGIRTGDLSWFMVHIESARDVMPVGSGW
jgi:hypothetical protein